MGKKKKWKDWDRDYTTTVWKDGKKFYGSVVVCKHDVEPVFEFSDVVFHGGDKPSISRSRIGSLVNPIVLNCTFSELGVRGGSNLIKTPEHLGFLKEHQFVVQYDEVIVDWTDYSIPPVAPTFWNAFIDGVLKYGYTDVIVCCQGGHGRTGTALGSLYMVCMDRAGDLPGADEVIEAIRGNYCEHAIETQSQEEYLEKLHDFLKREDRK